MHKIIQQLFSQVHQPFFIAGLIHALIVMALFGFAYQGIYSLSIDAVEFHAYALIYNVFSSFFIGFVFTTFPRFCSHEPIQDRYYTFVFVMMQLGSFIFFTGAISHIYILLVGICFHIAALFLVVIKLHSIYSKTTKMLQNDPRWILIGFYFGLLGNLLYLLYFTNTSFNPSFSIFYLYLIGMTFTIAQRMVPFFSHSHAKKNILVAPLFFLGMLLKVIFHSIDQNIETIIDIVIGLGILYEILRWKTPLTAMPPILKILHFALYWLVIAFLGGSVVTYFAQSPLSQLQLHIVSLGFITVMFFGFGTRVALGHSGRTPYADIYMQRVFYALHLLVLVRSLFSLLNTHDFFWLFDLSILMWLGLFLLWGIKFTPILLNPR